jgi:hypothetical protein
MTSNNGHDAPDGNKKFIDDTEASRTHELSSSRDLDASFVHLAGMSRRQQRKALKQYRKQKRRDAARDLRDTWVENAIDRPLPESVKRRLPGWVETSRGRWVVFGLGAAVLLVWAMLLWLIVK